MEEIETVLSLYSADSAKLSAQLQDILIIRGWAISLFTLLIGSSIFLNEKLYSSLNFVVILVFYLLEVTYDAYRIVLFQKTKVYESWLVKNANLPSEIKAILNTNMVETEPYSMNVARIKAILHPARLFVYIALTTVTLLYLILA
jgi:uncharacterized membrane protein